MMSSLALSAGGPRQQAWSTSAFLLVILLVERASAWSGVGGETCAFPTVDYLSLDQGAGISATNIAAGLGDNVYVAGYMTGERVSYRRVPSRASQTPRGTALSLASLSSRHA
jgi:hypothetical protein